MIGYMGSGKTSVGRVLSRYLRWRLVDLDREVSLAARRSIPEIFEDSGEDAFREMEHQALRRAVGGHRKRVIACGGGVITHHPNLETLQKATTIFLEENIGLLYSRTRKKGRPLRAASRAEFERRYEIRLPLYREAADRTVVVNGRRPEKVARELEQWIRA